MIRSPAVPILGILVATVWLLSAGGGRDPASGTAATPRDPYDIGLPMGDPGPVTPRVLLRDELEQDEDSVFNGRRPSADVSFTAGVVGRGAWLDGSDRLAYPVFPSYPARSPGKPVRRFLAAECGAVDFWHRPAYPSDEGLRRVLFFVTGGTGTSGEPAGQAHSILLEKTAAGALQLTLTGLRNGPLRTWRLAHPAARWQAGEWHHIAIGWRAGPNGTARLWFDGVGVSAPAPGFALGALGADFCIGSADGRHVATGTFDRVRTWEGMPDDFGDLRKLRARAAGAEGRHAGILVNCSLEDESAVALAGGKVVGARTRGDGFVGAGWIGRAFACRAARNGSAPARLVFPTRIPGGRLGPRSSFWPPRGAVELYFRPSSAAPRRRVLFHLDQAAPPGTPRPTFPARAEAPEAASWVIEPDNRLALTFRLDDEFLFSVARADSLDDLENDLLSETIREEFKNHDIQLSDDVAITLQEEGKKWQIEDKDETYLVVVNDETLNIYDHGRLARVRSGPLVLTPGRWIHLACAWDLADRSLRIFAGGKPLPGELLLPAGSEPLRPVPTVSLWLDIGHEKGRDVLGGDIDSLKIYDRPRIVFPAADGVVFRHRFDSRWSNIADYAEGDRIAFGRADPDADGVRGAGVRVAGRSVLRFVAHYPPAAGAAGTLANVDPNRGTVSFWLKPSRDTLDGSRRMLAHFPFRGWRLDAVALYLEAGRLHAHVARHLPLATDPLKLQPGAWIHLAMTWDRQARSAAIFVDGREAARRDPSAVRTPAQVLPLRYPAGDWWSLGSGASPAETAQAVFDELTVHRRVLSAEQIALSARFPSSPW